MQRVHLCGTWKSFMLSTTGCCTCSVGHCGRKTLPLGENTEMYWKSMGVYVCVRERLLILSLTFLYLIMALCSTSSSLSPYPSVSFSLSLSLSPHHFASPSHWLIWWLWWLSNNSCFYLAGRGFGVFMCSFTLRLSLSLSLTDTHSSVTSLALFSGLQWHYSFTTPEKYTHCLCSCHCVRLCVCRMNSAIHFRNTPLLSLYSLSLSPSPRDSGIILQPK